jgi:hydroxymethylpyrimidine pyrophosphatase-like HAD family hydrolase
MTRFRDVMMFSGPASAVAMGNAGGQLKGRASTVNDCFDDQGLGEAIERCVLDSGTRSR